jgi:hypothetical protein
MRRWLQAFVLLAVMPRVAAAGDVHAYFAVSAFVAPRASLEAITQPSALRVTREDIARGYVDVSAVYRVQNNDPGGYMVRLAPRTGLTRSIEVSGLATRVVMTEEVVEVSQPAALQSQRLDLRFRLVLDEAAIPGTYAMPVHVAVASL